MEWLRHARQIYAGLLRRPGFAVASLLMFTLAVAANGAAFAVFYAYLLRPLPYPDASRLVAVHVSIPKLGLSGFFVSPRLYEQARKRPDNGIDQSALFNYGTQAHSLDVNDSRYVARTGEATPSWFRVLGVVPALGRLPAMTAGRVGGPRQAIIAYAFWQRAFGGQASALGQALDIHGKTYRIVGVLPRSLSPVPGFDADVYIPLVLPASKQENNNINDLMIARLRPGASPDRLTLTLRSLVQAAIAKASPKQRADFEGVSNRAVPLHAALLQMEGGTSLPWVLQGIALLLWLLATVNVTNLAMVRHRRRLHAFAIRDVLGAGRPHLVGMLILEQAPLAVLIVGFSAGIVWQTVNVLKGSSVLSSFFGIGFGWPELLCILVLTLAGLLTSVLLPVWQTGVGLLRSALGEGPSATLSRAARRTLRSLGTAQVALATVLLMVSLTLTGSLYLAMHRAYGFVPKHRLVVDLLFPPSANAQASLRELTQALRTQPYALDAAVVGLGNYPFSQSQMNGFFAREGGAQHTANWTLVSPRFFSTMGITFLSGDTFSQAESAAGSSDAVVIGEGACHALFEGKNCLGQTLKFGGLNLQVQGVVAPVAWNPLPWQRDIGTIYLPLNARVLQAFHFRINPASIVLHLRPNANPSEATVRRLVQTTVPGVVVTHIRPYSAIIRAKYANRSLEATIVGLFAFIAVSLAAFGVFAVQNAMTQARMPEYGLRAVLGAQPGQLVLLAMREVGWILGIGLVPGVVLAYVIVGYLAPNMYRVSAVAPYAMLLSVLVIGAVVILSTWLPTRKVSKRKVRDLLQPA